MPRTKKPSDARLSIRVTSEDMERLRQYAEQENLSVTETVTGLIRRLKLKDRQ